MEKKGQKMKKFKRVEIEKNKYDVQNDGFDSLTDQEKIDEDNRYYANGKLPPWERYNHTQNEG